MTLLPEVQRVLRGDVATPHYLLPIDEARRAADAGALALADSELAHEAIRRFLIDLR